MGGHDHALQEQHQRHHLPEHHHFDMPTHHLRRWVVKHMAKNIDGIILHNVAEELMGPTEDIEK